MPNPRGDLLTVRFAMVHRPLLFEADVPANKSERLGVGRDQPRRPERRQPPSDLDGFHLFAITLHVCHS
jgi:hypothetical protein